FNSCIAQSCWESFTVTLKVTLKNPAFFDRMTQFSGNQPGTGGLVTFKDSNWLLSIVLAHQPHFRNQPAGVQGVLGILAISGPGRQFRSEADGRVPWRGVEIPDDVVFTVEYSVRAAQMAVYELLDIDRKVPPVTPHDKSLRAQFEALVKAF